MAHITFLIGDGSDENEKCFGYEENGNWIFSTSPLECNTNIFTNATHIVYTNYLHGKIGIENAIITRSKQMNLEFKCVFSNEVDIGLENPIETKEDSMEVPISFLSMNISYRPYNLVLIICIINGPYCMVQIIGSIEYSLLSITYLGGNGASNWSI